MCERGDKRSVLQGHPVKAFALAAHINPNNCRSYLIHREASAHRQPHRIHPHLTPTLQLQQNRYFDCTAITARPAKPNSAPRQHRIPTNPHSAACAISTAQDYHPNLWSNSSSGVGSASTPALCNYRSCPATTSARIRADPCAMHKRWPWPMPRRWPWCTRACATFGTSPSQ